MKKLKYCKPIKNQIIYKIPFYSQDETGTKNKFKNWLWQTNGCGMACLKMILKHRFNESPRVKTRGFFNKAISISELGERCTEYGGFVDNPSSPDKLDGLFYKPFIKFIKKGFGLNGKIVSPMVTQEILYELEQKNYVIASVSSKIRNPKDKPNKKGGHLVLVVGYDLTKEVLYINNPSFSQNTKMPMQISFADFNKFFANRGIVIEK